MLIRVSVLVRMKSNDESWYECDVPYTTRRVGHIIKYIENFFLTVGILLHCFKLSCRSLFDLKSSRLLWGNLWWRFFVEFKAVLALDHFFAHL